MRRVIGAQVVATDKVGMHRTLSMDERVAERIGTVLKAPGDGLNQEIRGHVAVLTGENDTAQRSRAI